MGARPVTAAARRRGWLWVTLALMVIAGVAALTTYLTAPRLGGRMDAASTGPDGAHALVTLLADRGVDVVVADSIADVERAARPDTLLLVAQSQLVGEDLLRRLADAPGDLLLVEPTSRTRALLAPGIRTTTDAADSEPNCALRAANRAGAAALKDTATYTGVRGTAVTSCYNGALIRYQHGGRTITVVGTAYFMMNRGLLPQGNAALAMNLAGAAPRLLWYAPQRMEGTSSATATFSDLIPRNVTAMIWQLCLAVALVALWKGRRIGPLVAEDLPVVVRASETVEGRGRLYRSRRARDRAAQALRTATLQRLTPRLGLSVAATPPTVVNAVAQRSATAPVSLHHTLFGPPPATDADLLALAHTLDDIERQVSHS